MMRLAFVLVLLLTACGGRAVDDATPLSGVGGSGGSGTLSSGGSANESGGAPSGDAIGGEAGSAEESLRPGVLAVPIPEGWCAKVMKDGEELTIWNNSHEGNTVKTWGDSWRLCTEEEWWTATVPGYGGAK